ncbi:hypothetical protein AB3S75_048062 [Citrus x aurantiifolia]
MKKAVFKVGVDDAKAKNKVLKIMIGLAGVESVSMDKEGKKLTVIGDIDPVSIVSKLRKLCHTEIVSVGPANEPEGKKKKDDDETKKDDEKKK